MKYTRPNILLRYHQVVNLMVLEKPIINHIEEKYPSVKINKKKLFSETTVNILLRLGKKNKDDKLNELLKKYINYIEQIYIEQTSDKYNI
jgi:hypothetical protein